MVSWFSLLPQFFFYSMYSDRCANRQTEFIYERERLEDRKIICFYSYSELFIREEILLISVYFLMDSIFDRNT